MTRLMYDAVNPAGIPIEATMVACYVDGRYANEERMRSRFPHAQIVEIAVRASTDAGQVLDVENGDATPLEAVGWVQMRRRAACDPTVYVSAFLWSDVRAAFRHAGIPEPHYWIADWDHSNVIPAGAVAKQFANTKTYDLSSVSAYWPGVDHPSHKPAHQTYARYVVKPGDTLSSIAETYGLRLSALEKLNPQIENFNLIHPGEVIHLSGHQVTRVTASYLVKSGDTLSAIAAAHHTTVHALMTLNPAIKDPDLIYAGSYIKL